MLSTVFFLNFRLARDNDSGTLKNEQMCREYRLKRVIYWIFLTIFFNTIVAGVRRKDRSKEWKWKNNDGYKKETLVVLEVISLVRLCFLKLSSFSFHSLIRSFIHSLFLTFFISPVIICSDPFLHEAFKVILLPTPLCSMCPFLFKFPKHFSVDISFLHHACNVPSSSHRLCVLSAESKHNCTTHVWTLGCVWTTDMCQVALHEIHFCVQIFVATSVSFN